MVPVMTLYTYEVSWQKIKCLKILNGGMQVDTQTSRRLHKLTLFRNEEK